MPKKVILSRPQRSARSPAECGDPIPPPPSKEGEEGDGYPTYRVSDAGEDTSGVQADGVEFETLSEVLRDQLLASIPRLTPAHQREVYEALALALVSQPDSGRDVDMWAHSVYSALVEANGTQGGGVAGPLVIKRHVAARSAWAPVDGFMRDTNLAERKVAERQACYSLLAKLLVQRAKEVARHAGIPLSAKLVAQNAADIAAIVDRAFPGYVRSGALAAVALRTIGGEAPPGED